MTTTGSGTVRELFAAIRDNHWLTVSDDNIDVANSTPADSDDIYIIWDATNSEQYSIEASTGAGIKIKAGSGATGSSSGVSYNSRTTRHKYDSNSGFGSWGNQTDWEYSADSTAEYYWQIFTINNDSNTVNVGWETVDNTWDYWANFDAMRIAMCVDDANGKWDDTNGNSNTGFVTGSGPGGSSIPATGQAAGQIAGLAGDNNLYATDRNILTGQPKSNDVIGYIYGWGYAPGPAQSNDDTFTIDSKDYIWKTSTDWNSESDRFFRTG